MEVIDQQVINDNKEIYAKIQSELRSAENEILIATAWFTDEDLYNILVEKLSEGVHIEVIIADNQENERLDFDLLSAKGAAIWKIKNSGYGIMNQKFCVIDKRIALHGSYNWSVNAKKNNHESIISTDHRETIESLIENFNGIKTRIIEKSNLPVIGITDRRQDQPKNMALETQSKTNEEFEQVLDSMIAAEIGSFDRKLLREQGFERCKANNGDHQVLYKAFDTVYSVFINDIDVIDDKKKRLITKIEEHRVRTVDVLNKNCELQVDHLEREHELSIRNLENRKTSLEAEVNIQNKNIEEIRSEKIPDLARRVSELDEQIKAAAREFITPKFKWFEIIPTACFGLALLVYLFAFYSSAAYILLFSVADAKEAQLSGGISNSSAQIFNPSAFGKALHKGGTAPLFIFLFVFIPLAFAIMDLFVRSKWLQVLGFIFGIVVLDGAIAYKVAEAVHDVNYLSGNTAEIWHTTLALTDTNFYLVFVFGAFGLFLFKFLFKKFIDAFKDRDPDLLMQRNRLHIKQLQQEISGYQERITLLKEEAIGFERQIIQLKADNKHIETETANLPIVFNRDLKRKKELLVTDCNTIEKTAAIYILHIQSDNLPISIDALKDRINVFLEGWNDYLFQEYAVARATAKTAQAFDVAMTWQNEKLQNNRVDRRLKFNTGE